jgi:hypothetical protein
MTSPAINPDGVQPLAHRQSLGAGVFVHQRDSHLGDLAPKSITQHDKLHQWENHRSHHERGIAEEFPHVAFDESEDPVKLQCLSFALLCCAASKTMSFPRKRESSSPNDVDPRLRGGDEGLTIICRGG